MHQRSILVTGTNVRLYLIDPTLPLAIVSLRIGLSLDQWHCAPSASTSASWGCFECFTVCKLLSASVLSEAVQPSRLVVQFPLLGRRLS
jgi:hypothetical protein